MLREEYLIYEEWKKTGERTGNTDQERSFNLVERT